MKTANTGDILLFRNKEHQLGQWLTRTITRSKFDHIAMIFRYKQSSDYIKILEAVHPHGVQIETIEKFTDFSENFEIYYRKLRSSNGISS